MHQKPELAAWVTAYTKDLLSWAVHKVSDRSTAEDLVQETFLVALEKFATFRNESHPRTWLFGILNNKIADHFRTRARSIELGLSADTTLDDLFDGQGRWKPAAAAILWTGDEPALFDDAVFIDVFQRCLEALPTDWRSVLTLKFLEEKSATDVCQELSLSTTNYWQIVHRAKLRMRTCLDRGWFRREEQ